MALMIDTRWAQSDILHAYHRSFHVGRQSDRVVQSFADYLVVVVTAIAYSMHD
jgi:hypothetical protein